MAEQIHIPAQHGVGFVLHEGQTLTVRAPQAEQVADLVAYAANDTREWLSSGRTIDYNGTIALSTGHLLYSNRSHPMLHIVEDTAGRHDFLLAPCSQEMFEQLHGAHQPHPSCYENLVHALSPYGIEPDRIPTAFNVFMDVRVDPSGHWKIHPPSSSAGDYVQFLAAMDLIVAVTACSAEQTNNGTFKPIDLTIA